MNFFDHQMYTVSLGIPKILHDLLVLLFVIIRLPNFINNFKDKISRNIYLAVLISGMYGSALLNPGTIFDLWAGEYDSEYRIICAVIGAFFILEVAYSLWEKLGQPEDKSNFSWRVDKIKIFTNIVLLGSIFCFFLFEVILGQPQVSSLHTESFSIGGNIYLGIGRILTRVYILVAVGAFFWVMLKLVRTTFRHDRRFRIRGWAAIGAVFFIESHHLIILLGTIIVMMNNNQLSWVKLNYENIAKILLIGSIISIAFLAMPRRMIDFLIQQRYKFSSYIIFSEVSEVLFWIMESMGPDENGQLILPHLSRSSLSYGKDLDKVVIALNDVRRIVIKDLDHKDIIKISEQTNLISKYHRFVDKKVIEEAILLIIAISKYSPKTLHSDVKTGWMEVSPLLFTSLDDTAFFYYKVAKLLKKIQVELKFKI